MRFLSKDGEAEDPLFSNIEVPTLVPMDQGQDLKFVQGEQMEIQGDVFAQAKKDDSVG